MKDFGSVALVSVALALAGGTAVADSKPGRPHHGKMAPGKMAPGKPDTARTRLSNHKLYRVSVAPQRGPARINTMHAWVLTLATPDGKPVEQAEIAVDGGMPRHGHGLPTAPHVTRHLGGGRYLVEGVRFNMTGWWELKFAIKAPKADTVTFNIVVE